MCREWFLTPVLASKLELEHVIIGPTPHMNLSMNSLGQLFSRNGISPMIENSQLPYRET